MIDECLPLNNNDLNYNLKLLDPACGSGIFLVTAYKRLVQRWRLKNKSGNELAKPTKEVLKEILKKNIFGVDINPVSVNLSIFSLQLALCSMLTPRQIWTDFKFDDLKKTKNIVQKDFFKHLIDKSVKHDFNLVIGNPPFKRNTLDNNPYEYYDTLLEENNYPVRFKNPQKEFAFLFLEKAMHLLSKKQGKMCLILPSGPLLYSDESIDMRKSLFSTFNVSQIIDFTFLRRVLFQATVAAIAVFIDNKPPTKDPILHITAKRTKQSKEQYYFEFDHYDFYKVPKKLVVDTINIWKCNLLGGVRICDIVHKFNKITPKLKDFLQSKQITILPDGIERKHVFQENEILIVQDLFSSPTERLKKNDSYLGIRHSIINGFPIEVTVDDFKKRDTFRAIGFHAQSSNDIIQLKKYLTEYADFIRFFIAAISGRQGIRSPYTFHMTDMETVPYVNKWKEYVLESDKIIIEDVAKYTIEEFGKGEDAQVNNSEADETALKEFAHVYSDALNLFYRFEDKRYILTSIKTGDAFFVCDIEYTDKKISQITINQTNEKITDLIIEWNTTKSKKINKIMRLYGDNMIRIIKPKQLRFWLKSKALRDADETFDDILNNR